MNRIALDFYGEMPQEMKAYMRQNGWHFNKKMCDYAVSGMRRKNQSTGRMEPTEKMEKDAVEDLLKRTGITLENAVGYDHVYVANMIKADFWRTSVEDDTHLALMVKDVIDDADQADGFIMHRWYADMIRKGMPIEWGDML